jgi:integrase
MKDNNINASVNSDVKTIIIFDKDEKADKGIHPVKIKIIKGQSKKLYPIGLEISQRDYDVTLMDNPRGIYEDYKELMFTKYKKACIIISGLETFTFKKFEDLFIDTEPEPEPIIDEPEPEVIKPKVVAFKPKPKKIDFYDLYREQIDMFSNNGKTILATKYGCSMMSLQEFREQLPFKAVNVKFLKSYEMWMLDSGRTPADVNSYLKPLQAMYSIAIQQNKVKQELYPFGPHKYKIPLQKNEKNVLTLSVSEISKLANHSADGDKNKRMTRDFFMLSFLCHGASVSELALLKWADLVGWGLKGAYVNFVRNKTLNNQMKGYKSIKVQIIPQIKRYIEKYRESTPGSSYLFPIIMPNNDPKKELTLKQELSMIKSFSRIIAKNIQSISDELGFDSDFTFAAAKDTFAATLRQAGASDEYIAIKLGHKDVVATRRYLDKLQTHVWEDFMKVLVAY